MTDDQFKALCNTYGFAPSRALREMLDKVAEMERESCAKVCELAEPYQAADLIRARSNT
jgi:hypothetical protein